MRDEAEAVIEAHGWTKAAMQRMRKIDSFLKESQRLNSLGSSEFSLSPSLLPLSSLRLMTANMTRKTLKDWTLSDGTLLPADSYVAIASDSMHKDEVRPCRRLLSTQMLTILDGLSGLFPRCTDFQRLQVLGDA